MELLSKTAHRFGLRLTPEHLAAFQLYYDELVAWNRRFNLTAVTDYEQVQIRHFLDSLTCLLVNGERARQPVMRVMDVGSGAGFPGLPLKIVCPSLQLTLLEATGKKVQFLKHVVEGLALEGVQVIKGRAEEVGHSAQHREQYDLVVARAVAELPVLAEYALPFCRLGGRFVAQKGSAAEVEVASAERALAILGGHLRRIHTVELPGLAEPRRLVVVDKMALTPEKYPRRPGIPSKRPLK